mmetsp:Transcript_136376/g.291238  ORF Transcript_136376/g.291238 Transcript_136376/m.291238 type:complete len:235 (+) Transcript_136376:71-775(+)
MLGAGKRSNGSILRLCLLAAVACVAWQLPSLLFVGPPQDVSGRRALLGAALFTGVAQGAAVHAEEGPIATFNVEIEGKPEQVKVRLHPEWAPRGVNRFQQMVRLNEYEDSAVYHVDDGFAHFGLPTEPGTLRPPAIKDDLVRTGNKRGTLTFTQSGSGTRIAQLFFNTADNSHLDSRGFAPIGEVLDDGMDVVDRFYRGYGNQPKVETILQQGNKYLEEEYPKLSKIKSVEVAM